jgi:DNA-binding beta-propeller fold protein YncE
VMKRPAAWAAVCSTAGVLASLGTASDIFRPAQLFAQEVPRFEVDPRWPTLPLGDGWITGGLGGMCIDGRDHVFVLNRQNVVPADLNAAGLAPPVIEFDPDGSVVRGWGDTAGFGDRLHDCAVDGDGNLWVVAAGTGQIRKFSHDGSQLLLQVGESGVYDSSDGTREGSPLNSDRAQFFLPASVDVDPETGDVYVADGELSGGNQRIAVVDREGNFLRQWKLHRAAGEENVTPLPHCIRVANDGLVYVCDRQADRIQVFDRMGRFIKNIDVPWPSTSLPEAERGATRGTAVVLAFSADAEQRLLFVVNQNSVAVDILDRQTGELLSSFGGGPGRYPGQFTLPHGIAVDSAGAVYVAEQEGRRVQKFRVVRP